MQLTEWQLRSLTLAQAIERTDAERALVSQADRDDATRHAVAAARSRGVPQVGLGDIVLDRSAAVVARASAADADVASLGEPSARLRWLARAMPVLTLLLGLAIDRMANAHRVDLLSPPLLLVLGWNLVMYTLLAVSAWRSWRHPDAGQHTRQVLHTLRRWARPAMQARAGRRGLAGRIAADFYRHWFTQTADLFTQRATRVLHLCAAAWAAGIALSLLLRGLFVRYQFGWESTFLDAEQVHAIATVLFWPLTAGFGLTPFSLQDIATTQDFAGQGPAGGRWVWMYVGLLALVVVLPRLALAAWARWRERQLARRRTIDLRDPAWDTLRHSLPGDLVLGLVASPQNRPAWRAMVAGHTAPTEPDTLHTAQGDRLRFVDAAAGTAAVATSALAQPVDAVIACIDSSANAAVPVAWQGAPQLTLRWADVGESWVLEPALFDHLTAALPQHAPSIARLRQAWVGHNETRFEQSITTIAVHLRACARLNRADSGHAARYAHLAHTLDTELRALHGSAAGAPAPAPSRSDTARPANALGSGSTALGHSTTTRGADGTAFALGTSAGAAAGAAAGAKMGAMIDIGTGGMTLGAGTALGALLGGGTAWVLRSLQKKDAAEDVLRHITEAACTHYLVIAHEARLPPQDASRIAGRWQAEVTGTVAVHQVALTKALQDTSMATAPPAPIAPIAPTTDALQALLRTMLIGVLRRSFETPPPMGVEDQRLSSSAAQAHDPLARP